MGNKIKFYNRYTRSLEEEVIYGEPFLRLLYSSKLGNLALNQLIKRKIFFEIYGRLMRRAGSKKKIKPFVERYKIDTTVFEKKIEDFKSFDDFFIHKLKRPHVRLPSKIEKSSFLAMAVISSSKIRRNYPPSSSKDSNLISKLSSEMMNFFAF
jgi:hypothetical protein